MGSKKRGILDRIREGEEAGKEAVDYGETLEGDGSEIKALLDSIDTSIDEDDLRSVRTAEFGYGSAFKGEFREKLDAKEAEMENLEGKAGNEASREREKVNDAAGKFREMAGVSDVGRQNAEGGADTMGDSVREYEDYISRTEEITRETRREVASLRSTVDGIFG